MQLTSKQRTDLHRMLDELLDAGDPESTSGVLLLREVVVKDRDCELTRSLSMRGFVGQDAALLREVVHQLKIQP